MRQPHVFLNQILVVFLELPNKNPMQLAIKSLNWIIVGFVSSEIKWKSCAISNEPKVIIQTLKAIITCKVLLHI